MKRFVVAALAALSLAGSASAAPVLYVAQLSGAAEVPVNASPGTGFAHVWIDSAAHTMQVIVDFQNLLGTVTASHIHCCTTAAGTGTAGVATVTPTFTGFPSGVTSGNYNRTFDMTLAGSYNPAYITSNGGTPASAEAALFGGIAAGKSYLNIHTSQFGGGEIRGFLQVPEPTSLALVGMGLAGLMLRRRRAS